MFEINVSFQIRTSKNILVIHHKDIHRAIRKGIHHSQDIPRRDTPKLDRSSQDSCQFQLTSHTDTFRHHPINMCLIPIIAALNQLSRVLTSRRNPFDAVLFEKFTPFCRYVKKQFAISHSVIWKIYAYSLYFVNIGTTIHYRRIYYVLWISWWC